jgi:hypothetical protein
VRGLGTERTDIMVESFPGIRTEQLHKIIEKEISLAQKLLLFTSERMT